MTSTAPTILVVDDDATARILMRAALHKAGFEVVLAGGGGEALRRFAEKRCDMVMLDVDMPDIGGLDVCRTLRTQAGELLPIVMVTGMDDVHSVEQAYEVGATDFISKPINWALIGHRARYLLKAAQTLSELHTAHARNAAILEAIPDTLFRLDANGMVLDVRDGASGPQAAPLAGQPLAGNYPPGIAERLTARARRAFESGMVQNTDFSALDPAGNRHYYETRVARIDRTEALCVVRDITARKRAEAELVLSQDRLEQAQTVARLGSWYLDVRSGALEWSAQTYRIFGVAEGTPIDSDCFFSLVLADDVPTLRQAWEQALAGKPYTVEYRIRRQGHVVWLQAQVEPEIDDDRRIRRVVGTVQDITERKDAETRIARLAYFDGLTGLPNRESFLDRLGREIQRAWKSDKRLAILFMDLDGFKSVNDTLGHHTGDRVLQDAADRLRAVVRPSDMVSRADECAADLQLARLGGDEFTLLLLDLGDAEHALVAAHRISEQMRLPFVVDGRDLRVTASIGIAVYPDDGADVDTLLKHADTAMYHAKAQGRDNYQFYSAALTQRAMQRMDLERDLRTALDQGQFHLAYQPQVDARTGRLASVEALIRWNHPQRGPVPPMDFIPLAESIGLIVPIGRCVLRMACEAAVQWQRAGHGLRVAVNLSPLQLKDPDLVQTVVDVLAETGLAAQLLELEITESALMEDSAATLATLHALRAAGVDMALDDFGTGYSSLSYLKRMPLTSLKVDRSFVSGLPEDKENDSIVRAIVSMAASLGFDVTAEGVETPEQAHLLTTMGCHTLQGWHFGKPVSAADIGARLEDSAHGSRSADACASPASPAPPHHRSLLEMQ